MELMMHGLFSCKHVIPTNLALLFRCCIISDFNTLDPFIWVVKSHASDVIYIYIYKVLEPAFCILILFSLSHLIYFLKFSIIFQRGRSLVVERRVELTGQLFCIQTLKLISTTSPLLPLYLAFAS